MSDEELGLLMSAHSAAAAKCTEWMVRRPRAPAAALQPRAAPSPALSGGVSQGL